MQATAYCLIHNIGNDRELRVELCDGSQLERTWERNRRTYPAPARGSAPTHAPRSWQPGTRTNASGIDVQPLQKW